MTKKAKIAAILAIVLAVLLVAAGLMLFRHAPPKPKAATRIPTAARSNICNPPWSCGRLAQGEPGMKPNTWYLKYADVTGAARLEIAFVSGAQCHVNGAPANCAHLWPPSGSAVNFNGAKDGDFFRVSSLDIATKK